MAQNENQILEGKKLILDFMGIKPKMERPDLYTYSDLPFISIRKSTPEKVMDGIINYAKYNTSWDWLMPVVQKIGDCGHTIVISIDEYFEKCVILGYDNGRLAFETEWEGMVQIDNVFSAVTEFLKWLNELKS